MSSDVRHVYGLRHGCVPVQRRVLFEFVCSVYFLLVSCAALLVRPGVYRTARRPHLASGVCALWVSPVPTPYNRVHESSIYPIAIPDPPLRFPTPYAYILAPRDDGANRCDQLRSPVSAFRKTHKAYLRTSGLVMPVSQLTDTDARKRAVESRSRAL